MEENVSIQELSALTRSYFNIPVKISISKNKEEPVMANNPNPDEKELKAILDFCKSQGFEERAVVIKKNALHRGDVISEWGVIDWVYQYVHFHSFSGKKPYCPISVRWLSDGSTSKHWPDELLLIHEEITRESIKEYLSLQTDK